MSSARSLRLLVAAWVVVSATLGAVVADGALGPATGGDGSTPADAPPALLAADDETETPSANGTARSPSPTGHGGHTAKGKGTAGTTPKGEATAKPTATGDGTERAGGAGTGTKRTRTPERTGTPGAGADGAGTPTTTPGPGTTATPEDEPVEGEPELSAFAPNNTVEPGERRRLVVQVSNGGTVDDGGLDTPRRGERQVTTARDVSVALESGDAPVEVRTGATALGDLESGAVAQAGFDVVVAEDAEPGVYELDVVVEYDYTESVSGDERDDESETETLSVVLVVTENARFEVVDVDSDVQVGERGTVEVTFENVGEESVRDAAVTFRSRNEDLRVDTGSETARFAGEWESGEERTVEFQATATNASAPQRYAVEATVAYTDGDGVRRNSTPLVFGVRPDAEQAFAIEDVASTLRVGEEGRVNGTVENEGPRDVSSAVVRLTSTDENLDPRETEVALGDLADDDEAGFSLPVSVADTAQPGERRLTFVVEYVTEAGDRRTSGPISVVVEVTSESDRLVVESIRSDLQADDTGSVVLALTNRGNETLSDATVSLASESGQLRIGDAVNGTRFVGDWPGGETRTVRYRVRAPNGTGNQTFALSASVEYEDEEGQSRRSGALPFGATPAREQSFAARAVESSLRVGEEGRATVRLTNRGPGTVSAVAVELVTDAPNVNPVETEVAVGALAPGESTTLSFPVEISESGDAGARQLTYRVRYADDEGDRRTSDPLTTDVRVAPERDPFVVDPVEATVTVGGDGTLVLEVTNNLGVPLRDVQAKAFADAPLSVDDDQAFVASIPPNGSATIRFDVSAGSEAGAKTYPLSVDFLYTGPDGDQQLSEPVDVGVTVVEPAGRDILDLALPALAVLLLLLVALWLLRRRRRGREGGTEEGTADGGTGGGADGGGTDGGAGDGGT